MQIELKAEIIVLIYAKTDLLFCLLKCKTRSYSVWNNVQKTSHETDKHRKTGSWTITGLVSSLYTVPGEYSAEEIRSDLHILWHYVALAGKKRKKEKK